MSKIAIRSDLPEPKIWLATADDLAAALHYKDHPYHTEILELYPFLPEIFELAMKVFANPDKAWRWLRKPKHPFEGRTPVDMTDTGAGCEAVKGMLYGIDI